MSDALRAKAKEVVSAIRSVNRSNHQLVNVPGEDQPCYWQRQEWIDWMLDLASELELVAAASEPDDNSLDITDSEGQQ